MEIALPRQEGILAKLEQLALDAVEKQILEFSICRKMLIQWEDQNLLDKPTPEKLAEHMELIGELSRYGQAFLLATSHPKFPRPELKEEVEAILFVLRDSYVNFHGPKLSKEKEDRILAAFDEK